MKLFSLALTLATFCLSAVAAQELDIQVVYKPEDCPIKTQDGDKLAMHYTGTLLDGSSFDSSRTRGKPFQFTLGARQVISGWEQGLQDMCIGEQRILTIPPHMAYGERGFPPVIPASATLKFDVELLDIKNRKAPAVAEKEAQDVSIMVENAISAFYITIFSKTYCPHCKRAKELIDSLIKGSGKANIIELDQHELGPEMQAYLHKRTGQRTVPSIFIAGNHIGGADAIQALHEQGKLHDLLIGRVGWAVYVLPAGLVFVLLLFAGTVYFHFLQSEKEEKDQQLKKE